MTMSAMRAALCLGAVALSPLVVVGSADSTVTREVLQPANQGPLLRNNNNNAASRNFTEQLLKLQRGPSKEELNEEAKARKQRARERSERAREKLKNAPPPDASKMHRMTQQQVEEKLSEQEDYPFMRRASWGSNSGGTWGDFLEDPSEEYDKWQQAYRFLGGYIDCDHDMSEGSGSGGDNNGDGDGDGSTACSRWMIWAAYVDESYSGMEYYEYYGDNPVGVLDCHDPDTSWKLLGVYRQEFYQYIEQISKHLWAIDEYEYVTALGGLAYMTDADCDDTGLQDRNGNEIYAGVQPLAGGMFQMALYTDGGYCLTPNENTGYSVSDIGRESNMQLESGDGDDGYNDDSYGQMQEWWEDSQEPYLTTLNEVYQTFRYCYSCVDYPTYQDGYFIGDDGTDDDDLINQCWKFWSHDSYVCETDCLAKAHAQGTILAINYNGQVFGSTSSTFYENYASSGSGASSGSETKMTRLMANVFVAFSFIVFVATFLAFAVARRSRQREKRSSKRRRLLDEDGKSRGSRSSRRRRAAASGVDGDGLFRSSRSKSADHRARSSSGRRSKSSSGKSRSKSRSSRRVSSGEEGGAYDPPRESRRTSSRSRRPLDDF